MLWWSWGRCPDVLVDFGRELYTAWQLSEGRTLYVDVAYFNGPLSPYWNALVFRCFGASVATLTLANAAVLGAILVLIYQLMSALAGRVAAWVGAMWIVLVCECGHYVVHGNYNFLYPYSHETTHGMLASVASIWCFWRFITSRRRHWLARRLACRAGVLDQAGVLFSDRRRLCDRPAAGRVAANPTLRARWANWCVFLLALLVPPVISFGLLSLAMPCARRSSARSADWCTRRTRISRRKLSIATRWAFRRLAKDC